eukprot:326450-Pyramimonas_sp.AAC.1
MPRLARGSGSNSGNGLSSWRALLSTAGSHCDGTSKPIAPSQLRGILQNEPDLSVSHGGAARTSNYPLLQRRSRPCAAR